MPALIAPQHRTAPLGVPRHDLLPGPVQRAELIRGTLVHCGPGVRGAGWPDTPLVRAVALAPWLTPDRTAILLTAAWIWGAAHSAGAPLEFASAARANTASERGVRARSRQLSPREPELLHLGRATVTTPTRTVADLLRLSAVLTREIHIACRVLAVFRGADAAQVAAALTAGPAPHRRRALTRLSRVSPVWLESGAESAAPSS
ncbi:hypothetical protein [Leucobacter chromiireducens]|uniref:hypothetical protein n=1 Tax=Leucobacter chromiireducens TaxID=283877 RepID=UPI003F81453E